MYLGICGKSNTGKTTLICEIIERMKDVKIAVVKHAPHGIDVQGKDSRRFRDSGAREVVLMNHEEVHFRDSTNLFRVIKELSKEYELILVEGFKKYKFLKKVCLGDAECEKCVLRNPSVEEVISYIHQELEIERIWKQLPNFNCGECSHKNCRKMAEAIYRGEDTFRGCRYWNPDGLISVEVNGKPIYMGKFAQDVVLNTLIGLLSSFKGVGKIEEVKIHLRRKRL